MLNSSPKATHLGSRIRTLAPPVVVRHLPPTPHPAGPSQMLPWMQPIQLTARLGDTLRQQSGGAELSP